MNALAAVAAFDLHAGPPGEWLVLRCSASSTLRLTERLNEAGFEAWSPTEEESSPMMARYVFVRERHLAELLDLIHNPFMTYQVWDSEKRRMVQKGYPHFRLLRALDKSKNWAIVRDSQLNALRAIERRRKPRGIVRTIPVGATVRLHERGFEGLDGLVERVRNKIALVSFPGWSIPVEIGCWLLTEKVDAAA